MSAWCAALRLPFFVPSVLLYATGALAGARDGGALDWLRALLGLAPVLLVQAAAILTNEAFDADHDAANPHRGRFNGGSGVVAEGRLAREALLKGIAVALVLLGLFSGVLLATAPTAQRGAVVALVALAAVLGVGHTAPPLRIADRGVGELNVAFTHTLLPMAFGWVLQGAPFARPEPGLIAMPAFCALLAARSLAGIPDTGADRAAGRRSYSVIFGPSQAAGVATAMAVAAAIGGALLGWDGLVGGIEGAAMLPAGVLALSLAVRAGVRARRGGDDPAGLPLGLSAWVVLVYAALPLVFFVRTSVG
jgi:1,4-dihydroxy-2-naphthoate octaprenyltransferase